MQSVAVVDRPQGVSREVNDLLVLWQHPTTREIVPIGRFARRGDQFTFAYTSAAAEVKGFRPLPGLGDLYTPYEGDVIPAVFNQRVMSADRPDYGSYLSTLGLTDGAATPWEQIVASGGGRVGDTLQFMPVPEVRNGRAWARFLVNGFSHIPDSLRELPGGTIRVTRDQQEAALAALQVGDQVLLEPELSNPEDPNAILLTSQGVPLGWVPRALSSGLRRLADSGTCSASVLRRGDHGTPYHLRLVVELDVPVPDGLTFDPDGRWTPLAAANR